MKQRDKQLSHNDFVKVTGVRDHPVYGRFIEYKQGRCVVELQMPEPGGIPVPITHYLRPGRVEKVTEEDVERMQEPMLDFVRAAQKLLHQQQQGKPRLRLVPTKQDD